MGISDSEVKCQKHPDHKQRKGVCPYCLRERLSQLNASSNKTSVIFAPSSSSTSFCSFRASSNYKFPVICRPHRNVSEVLGSMSFKVGSVGVGINGLKKSRSIAFAPRNLLVGEAKKKNGFWSKLLYFKGNKEGLMQSRSVSRRLY
ncbi:DUF740 domain-containing protein [Cephalotus follicularis]|uniref:DUF740 domain-containing protein n=1 Tax=Cephalotus follicularis TaxID=3775 RepID=A0A1Q3CSK9_CEPFO|nr:DUF740 domain-containing protein [Cephalotus follicularis]